MNNLSRSQPRKQSAPSPRGRLHPQTVLDMNGVRFAEFIAQKKPTEDRQMQQAESIAPASKNGALFPKGISNAVHAGKVRPMRRRPKWRSLLGDLVSLLIIIVGLAMALGFLLALCGLSTHRSEATGGKYATYVWGVRIR